MPAYWIARIDVSDTESYSRYAALAGPAIKAYGGEFLARGGEARQMEGQGRARNVLVRFPDLDAAEGCYRSPAYQEALTHARGASERELVLVEGIA